MPSDFDWATLPLNDLVRRLVALHLDILTECIRCLLAQRRPTLNSRSRQKTCSGLVIHICERLKYLLTVGSSMVCNILLCYLPFTAPSALPDSHYILLILYCYIPLAVDVAKRASTTPFWRTYDTEDRYVLIVHSDPLIKDLPDLKAMSGPCFSRAEIGKSSILMSPSRYAGLLNSHPALHDASVISPNVQDGKGVLILPGEYASKLHDGDIVEVQIILKLWSIKANKSGNDSFARDANGSRVYQLVLKNMTLLPAEQYTQPAMIKAPNFKGKRKASSEAQGQSPTKKGTKKVVAGGSESAAQDMDVL
ncbi:hypothetical protein BDN67DRAFT_1006308 [Paxillus ammoniavirescens]|nr:hypothetical protein BDN67DRAFT_1006308 [Paxillus ammoniavirescens]